MYDEAMAVFCDVVASLARTTPRVMSDQRPQQTAHNVGERTKILSPTTVTSSRSSHGFDSISDVVGSIQMRLSEQNLPCSPSLMTILLEDLSRLISVGRNIARALEDTHRMLRKVKSALVPDGETSRMRDRLVECERKLVFLRACTNPSDSTAVAWQASTYPTMQHEVSIELCHRLTGVDARDIVDQPAARSAAGPNWRHMIRGSTNQMTVDKPLITPL